MRTPPTDKWDRERLEELKPEKWMLPLLEMNPSYTCWGPHEDYMWVTDEGWSSRVLLGSWDEFDWDLDEYNEVVNFYFELERNAEDCLICSGTGTHPDAMWISESFYKHSSPFTVPSYREFMAERVLGSFGSEPKRPLGRDTYPSEELLEKYGQPFRDFCEEMREHGFWKDRLTDDEWDFLIEKGRAKKRGETSSFGGHDAINRWYLIEKRCERLGLPLKCPKCGGTGYEFTEESCHLNLILWVLHPRKGCSRGVEIKYVKREDLDSIFAFLREAAERNAERFSKIPEAVQA